MARERLVAELGDPAAYAVSGIGLPAAPAWQSGYP